MSKGSVFVILSALLLLQGCCCKPHTDTDTKTTDSSEENQITPNGRNLVLYVFKELTDFIDYTLKEGEKFLKDVITDVSDSEDKDNEEIKLRIKKLSEIVDRMEKVEDSADDKFEEKWDISSDMFDILSQYNMTTNEDPTAEDKIMETYIEKHGIESFKSNGRTKMVEGLDSLGEKFETFWNDLTPEGQEAFTKFHTWQLKFKEETDYLKKLQLIMEFFFSDSVDADD